jgi:integrating conjugative element protein (TIGR03765 family)
MRIFQYFCYGMAVIGIGLAPMQVLAELTVIYDSGNTRSLAPYLEILNDPGPIQNAPPKTGPKLGAADVKSLLPIRSPGLSPGPVQARSHNRPFSRPFFLVGSGERSRRWLRKHRQRLEEIGAVGMLVQALQTIARLAGELSIMPASATDIGTALGIAHYPVLISKQGIEQ